MSRRHRKQYHLLPPSATRRDTHAPKFDCAEHFHLSFADLYGTVPRALAEAQLGRCGAAYLGRDGLLDRAEVEWLCFPSVLRIVPDLSRQLAGGAVALRGLSVFVGQYLRMALLRKEPWAEIMLADMRRCVIPPSEDSPGTLAAVQADVSVFLNPVS